MIFETKIRVRYKECDQMGFVHNTNYAEYFEVARTEMLRQIGIDYRQTEQEGSLFVLVKLACQFHKPARYDDLITVRSYVTNVSRVKVEIRYEIYRDEELLTTGTTLSTTIDRAGRILPVPQPIKDCFQNP